MVAGARLMERMNDKLSTVTLSRMRRGLIKVEIFHHVKLIFGILAR